MVHSQDSDIGNPREAKGKKEQKFVELAQCFRVSDDPAEVKRLGEELGRMFFGE
jgi:hypothetical protein